MAGRADDSFNFFHTQRITRRKLQRPCHRAQIALSRHSGFPLTRLADALPTRYVHFRVCVSTRAGFIERRALPSTVCRSIETESKTAA